MTFMVNQLIGFGAGGVSNDLLSIIQRVGASDNLQLCLDAGFSSSYDGSSQFWNDVSPNADAMTLGDGSTPDARDPTFNGVAGALSSAEYFSSDGGDYFRIGTNPAWVDNIHDANQSFTILAAFYPNGTGAGPYGLCGTDGGSSSQPGFHMAMRSNRMDIHIGAISAKLYKQTDAGQVVDNAAWNIFALSFDEGANSGFFWNNGGYLQVGSSDTFTTSHTGTGTAATYDMNILARGNTASLMPSGTRIACFAAWQHATAGDLTKATLDDIFTELGPRFGL